MSDSAPFGSQVVEEVKSTVGEVAKDVKDALGEMIEQGVQSATASPLTPQQIQDKNHQDQKDLNEARRKLAFYQLTDEQQRKVIEENKRKERERLQVQQQEAQKRHEAGGLSQQGTKRPGAQISEEVARTRQEIGKGHGIGG